MEHWGSGGTYVPLLDFPLLNFSGHFRAAQTQIFDSKWFPIQEKIYRPIALLPFIA